MPSLTAAVILRAAFVIVMSLLTWGAGQVPSPWRSQIEDLANVQLMFDFYSSTQPPLSSLALECLVSRNPLLFLSQPTSA